MNRTILLTAAVLTFGLGLMAAESTSKPTTQPASAPTTSQPADPSVVDLAKCEKVGSGNVFLDSSKEPATASRPTTATSQPFAIKCRKADDRVQVAVESGKAIFTITSPSGISEAKIERVDAQWPKGIVLRLHLTGLESLAVTCGDMEVLASVSSHGGAAVSQQFLRNGKVCKLWAKDPHRIQIVAFDAPGEPAKDLPGKGGYFEITIPKALLDDKAKTLKLVWIDFYR